MHEVEFRRHAVGAADEPKTTGTPHVTCARSDEI